MVGGSLGGVVTAIVTCGGGFFPRPVANCVDFGDARALTPWEAGPVQWFHHCGQRG